ncbi:MAG TPA: hypothetical protein VIM16_09020 [Mucilaginibacter sp.]|jgi:hypothetical protein
MEVKIIKVATNGEVKAIIRPGRATELPSIQDDWRFNFDKQIKRLANSTAYILVAEETPEIVEGCMIFQMVDKIRPNLAFIEIAPHNRINERKYDHVAGCLIAYAFQRALIEGKGDYNGILFLDVLEEKEEDQKKLMNLYSKKYNAKTYRGTRMVIADNDGHELIKKYLEPK